MKSSASSNSFYKLKRYWGLQSAVGWSEKLVAAVGGFCAIFTAFYLSWYFTGFSGAVAILPSMGAATVLLFAVPHGQLSTPWAIFAGNLVSAVIGVTCAKWLASPFVASAMAVALSIFAMLFLRCLHPPGGATALAAVIGGEAISDLGYWYVLLPTLCNCLLLYLVAILYNNRFHWRRYPLSRMRYQGQVYSPDTAQIKIHHIHQAIAQAEVVMDISDEQVKRIVDLADSIMRQEAVAGFHLEVGAFYTNGKAGLKWSVRQVVDAQMHENPALYKVIYRTVDGANRGQSGSCSLQEFASWASEKMRPAAK